MKTTALIILAMAGIWSQQLSASPLDRAGMHAAPLKDKAAYIASYKKAVDETARQLKIMTQLLNTVKDRASADAAAPMLLKAHRSLDSALLVFSDMECPEPEMEDEMQAYMDGSQLSHICEAFLQALQPILEADYYGSAAMRQVFEDQAVENIATGIAD